MAIISMFSGGGSASSVPLKSPTDFLAEARDKKVALTWADPTDETTSPGGITVATWKYTRIVRKTGGYPTSPNDGVLVVESSVRDQYKTTPFEDGNLENGTLYYYAAYAYSDNNVASDAATTSVTPSAGYVFGVQWDMSNSSTALIRLTPDNDPNHYVNHLIESEPAPAVGSESGSSPFDNFYPWKGMEEYNVVNSKVEAKQGDEGFSRTSKDVMVWVPEFYYHIQQDGDIVRYYISSLPKNGFEKHPGSGVFMSRYEAINESSVLYSKSGKNIKGGNTITEARQYSSAKGSGWRINDYAAWCARNLLYLVEFADFNCQKKIGKGNNVSTLGDIDASGKTDSLIYHTGRENENVYGSVQYRHIENPWGNMGEYVDGIAFKGEAVWVSTNPSEYDSTPSERYTNIGNAPASGGYIKRMDVPDSMPWAMFPTASGGSSSTYVTDNYAVNPTTNWRFLMADSYDGLGDGNGLWTFRANGLGDGNSTIGFRLIFDKPDDWEPEVT